MERVHGVVHIESIRGQGTTVTMTLPMSMVLQNVVVVAAGDLFWGFPETSVEAAMPLAQAEIKKTKGGRELHFESGAIPCVSLSQAVGSGDDTDESELLIMNTRLGLVAVTVSELIDRRRVAVKNLGPILEGPGHVTGAALLGAGEVLVVLDPNFSGCSPEGALVWWDDGPGSWSSTTLQGCASCSPRPSTAPGSRSRWPAGHVMRSSRWPMANSTPWSSTTRCPGPTGSSWCVRCVPPRSGSRS